MDVILGSDESDYISDEDISSIIDIPDTLNYRWPKNIIEVGESIVEEEADKKKQLQLKLHRATDKMCAFGSIGNTRICCVVMTPVNDSDQDDFEAGVSVKIKGVNYVNERTLRDCITSMIPSNKIKRVYIDITFHVYSDAGNVIPTSLMTAMFALAASNIDIKGIVTAVSVLITPQNDLIVNPSKEEEQKARDKTIGYSYVTAMKIMKDDHLRWWDVEGLSKASQISITMKKAAKETSELYPHVASIVKQLIDNSGNLII